MVKLICEKSTGRDEKLGKKRRCLLLSLTCLSISSLSFVKMEIKEWSSSYMGEDENLFIIISLVFRSKGSEFRLEEWRYCSLFLLVLL